MADFQETSHGRYDTGGHPSDLLFSSAQSLIKRGGGWANSCSATSFTILKRCAVIHFWKYTIFLRFFFVQPNKCHAEDTARVSVNSESERRHRKQKSKKSAVLGKCHSVRRPQSSRHFLIKFVITRVLYCIVLYCGRVPAANVPGCTAAEGLLYKPWYLIFPTCTARCLHQRP